MNQYYCEVCGEKIVESTDREDILNPPNGSESAFMHAGRTGHLPKTPELMYCDYCEIVWFYNGGSDEPVCKDCGHRASEYNLNVLDGDTFIQQL